MDQDTQADICIVGAGPVGGVLACRLAEAGLSVVVIDRVALSPMEHPAFDGRAYAIAAGSRRLLGDAGLWPALAASSCPIHDIRVTDGRIGQPASRLFLHFDHFETEAREPFGWMVEARALRIALNAALNRLSNIEVFAPADAIVTRTQAGAEVKIAGGPTIACQLVIAAEGRNSPLREAAGIAVTRMGYDQTGMVFAIGHSLPHNNVALEHFLPSGPFAQLPMAASADAEIGGVEHVSAVVWTERTETAKRILALDDARLAREIGRRLGPHLGTVRPLGRRWSYLLSAMHAHHYIDTRLAVVGDAAHGIHPIAGQGLNLGFRDVIALSDRLIAAHTAKQDLGGAAVLASYQRARRGANLTMLAATDGLDRLFSSNNPVLRAARDIGIGAVHRLPRLKRAFMRQAMGS